MRLASAAVICLLMAAPRPARADDGLAARLAEEHRSTRDHDRRLEHVSRWFLGAGYARSPLGEGPSGQIDRDPLARFDRFDCVTYVEEMLALSWKSDLDEAVALLQRLRYAGGRVGYRHRNHLMMAQWIPNNIAAGFLRDVSAEVAGAGVKQVSVTLDHARFETKHGKKLQLEPGARPLGRHSLPVVPLDLLLEHRARIPDGTVITTIRSERRDRPYRATHVALILRVDGRPRVRHADERRGRVVEESLSAYLARARRQRWPVIGFHLAEVMPRPRVQ